MYHRVYLILIHKTLKYNYDYKIKAVSLAMIKKNPVVIIT